jgi:hypothetical protein
MQSLLPGYVDVLGSRYPLTDMLLSRCLNVDLVFLEATWRYSKCVGADAFPCGQFVWPPAPGWKAGVSGLALPLVEGTVACTSAGMVPVALAATSSSSSSSSHRLHMALAHEVAPVLSKPAHAALRKSLKAETLPFEPKAPALAPKGPKAKLLIAFPK